MHAVTLPVTGPCARAVVLRSPNHLGAQTSKKNATNLNVSRIRVAVFRKNNSLKKKFILEPQHAQKAGRSTAVKTAQ
jgi:hypothetical protein